jgi:hypothetical protein
MAMIAMTTRSSISVKPARSGRVSFENNIGSHPIIAEFHG